MLSRYLTRGVPRRLSQHLQQQWSLQSYLYRYYYPLQQQCISLNTQQLSFSTFVRRQPSTSTTERNSNRTKHEKKQNQKQDTLPLTVTRVFNNIDVEKYQEGAREGARSGDEAVEEEEEEEVEDLQESMIPVLFQELQQNLNQLNTEPVHNLLKLCRKYNNVETAQKVYSLGKQHLRPLSVSFFTAMIQIYCKLGQMDEAFTVYNEMQEVYRVDPDVRLFSVLLFGYTKAKMFDKISYIEEAITFLSLQPDEYTYKALIFGYLSGRMLINAEKVFFKMQQDSTIPIITDIYERMIEAYSQALKIEDAYNCIRYLKCKHITPTLSMYNAIIKHCKVHKNHSVAWGCFKEILQVGLVPSMDSWNGLIEVLCLSNKIEAARKIKAMMEEKGVKPNSDTYGSIIVALAQQKMVVDVESLFLEMREKGHQASPTVWRFVIETFLKSKQIEKAFLLVDQMRKENIPIKGILKNILITHCTRKGKLEWYTSRFGTLPKQTLEMDGVDSNVLYQILPEPRVDWEEASSALSIARDAKMKRQEKEKNYKERLKELEQTFIKEPLRDEVRKAMMGQQGQLEEQKRKESNLPTYVPKQKKTGPPVRNKIKKKSADSSSTKTPKKPKRKSTPRKKRLRSDLIFTKYTTTVPS